MAFQFHLNQKHLDYQESVNKYLQPLSACNDDEILKSLASDGYISLPSNVNSKVCDYLSLALTVEEIAKLYPAIANKAVELLFAQEAIKRYAKPELQESCALKVANLEVKVNVLFTEPGNYGVDTLSTKVLKTDNEYKLTGTKVFAKENVNADKYLVVAKMPKGTKTELVLVGIDADKVSIVNKEVTLGASSLQIQLAEIDTVVEADQVLNTVTKDMREALTLWRTLIAASAVGLAHSHMISSLGVVKTTKDSSNQQLTSSQAVQFTLADMFGEIEGARLVTYYSSALIDAGTPSVRFSSIAKAQASEAVVFAANKSADLFGSIGNIYNQSYFESLQSAYNRHAKDGTIRNNYNVIYEEALARR